MPVIPANQLTYLRDQHPHTARVEWFLAVAPYGNPAFHARVDQAGWVDERGEMNIDFDAGQFGDTLDDQQGAMTYNPVANSFRDQGQDFSQWQTTVNDALYVIRIVNQDATVTWAFLGADFTSVNPNDSILVYQDSELITAGWCGTAPGGKTPTTYTIHVAPNAGMTLWIDDDEYSAYDVGRVRLRSVEGDNVNGVNGTVHVAENSEIEWTDNDFLTCPGAFGFRELWGKYPRMTETGGTVNFLLDYDQDFTAPADTIIPPKANAGPPGVQWITGGNADLSFTGDRSYTTGTWVGAAIASYLWNSTDATVAAGALNVAGSCAAPNTLRWTSAGFRYVPLDVTDNSGQARTERVYVPVWIFDEGTEDPFKLAEISSQNCGTDNGWRLALKAFQTNTAAEDIIYNWPDGALVVLFTRTWFGDTETGVGGWCMASDKHYRDNIRFVGWLLGETLKHDFAAGTVEFEAVAHDGIMRLIPGWPFTIEDIDGVPTDWYEVADLNVDRALHYLLEFYSTVNQVCHVERVGEGNTRPVKIQSYSGSSLYEQAQDDLLSDAKCLLLSDRQGILYATQDPQFLNAAGRGGVAVACHLQQVNPNGQADWLNEIDETKPHRPVAGMVRVGGFAFDTPLLARAPGAAPVQQANEERVDGLIFVDQTEANLWAGLTLTQANLDYPQIPLELVGYWPVFDPAYQEYVELTVTDPTGRRSWAAQDFIVRQVSFDDRVGDGTSVTNLVLEKASQILTGETVIVPETPSPESPKRPSYTPPPTWGGDLTHVIIMTTQGIFVTETFNEETPVWYASNASLTDRLALFDMSFDFAHGSRLFTVGASGAWRCSDIWNTDAWTMPFANADAVAMIDAAGGPCTSLGWTGAWSCVNCEPTSGYLEFIAGCDRGTNDCDAHKRAFYSPDALVTCFVGDDLDHDPACGGPVHPATPWAGQVSSFGGHSLYTYNCGWGFNSDKHRGLCTDGGISVDTCGFSGGQLCNNVLRPLYHARAGATVYYFIENSTDMYYSTDHGSSWVLMAAVLPHAVPIPAVVWVAKQTLCVHNLNTSNLVYCGGINLQYSTDGGTTWGNTTTNVANSVCTAPAMVSGYPEGQAFVVGCSATPWVHVTVDFGNSWKDKSGNLSTWLGVGDSILQIVPVQEGVVT